MTIKNQFTIKVKDPKEESPFLPSTLALNSTENKR